MSRLPRAKAKILLAARQIVEREGAGALTFDELSRVSGVTRGGITYHYPTKDALLKALLEHDMAQWASCEAELTPGDLQCPRQAELIGFIRSHTHEDDGRRRFVAGMLSAAVHQPELLEPCRAEVRQRFAEEQWNATALRAHVLRLAAIGLFWEEIFQMNPLPNAARTDLVAMLEELARDWVNPASSSAPSEKNPKN